MAEGATPRRKPVLDTSAVTKAVIEWFQNKSQWRMVEAEMALPITNRADIIRRADIIAANYTDREFYIVEVKAQWNDFIRDRKFLEYRKWCDWFAFAMPEELISCARKRMDEIPGYDGVGLLMIPNSYGARRLVRRPVKNKMTRANYLKMAERWGKSCWGRLLDARAKNAELEWRLR